MILYRLLERANFRGIARRLYRVTITGAGQIPPAGAAILVANHESMFDPWLLALATRGRCATWRRPSWRIPLVGRALDAFGTFGRRARHRRRRGDVAPPRCCMRAR